MTTTTTNAFLQSRLRALVEGFYDAQEVRIRLNNRLRQVAREMEQAGVPVDDSLYEPLKHEERAEQTLYRMIGAGIRDHPLERRWRGQKGIGPIAIGGMVAWLDPAEAPHASSFWRFMGLDVQCSVCHKPQGSCDHDATGMAPRRQRGVKTTWNPTARVHAWKVGRSLLMQANEHYRPIYDEFKAQEGLCLKSPSFH